MSGSGSTYFGVDIEFLAQDGFWVANDLHTTDVGIVEVK